jgi:uncharacterized protein YjbI with pentapeptide repeats
VIPGQKLDIDGNIRATGAIFTGPVTIPVSANYTGTTLIEAFGGKADLIGANFTGNVGIGSVIPGQKLDVNGNIRATGAIFTGPVTIPASANYSGTTLIDAFGGKASLSGANFTGNVGIGSVIPGQKLDIDGNIRATGAIFTGPVTIPASANYTGTTLIDAFGGKASLSGANFTGNVGIGSAIPGQKLDIDGNIRATGAIFTGSVTIPTSANYTGTTLIDAFGGKASLSGANFTGNVGIGSVIPGQKLDIDGNIKATNATFTGTLNVNTTVGSVGIGSSTVTGPFIKQGSWTAPGTSHTITDFYVSENSSGNILINVKLPSSSGVAPKNGSANVSFIKTLGAPPEIFIISLHMTSNLTAFTISVSGNNIVVGTDANCRVCWTSTGAF